MSGAGRDAASTQTQSVYSAATIVGIRESLLRVFLAVFLLLPCAAPAQPGPTLYIGYASVEPQMPAAGQPVNLRFWTGPCVGIFDDSDDTKAILEDSITFVVDGVRWTNPTFCLAGYTLREFPIGSYPVGSFTLIAQLRYRNFFGHTILETFGTLDFEVAGAPLPPEPVPGLAWHWLWFLALGVLLLAARRMHARTLFSLLLLAAGINNNNTPISAQSETPKTASCSAHCNPESSRSVRRLNTTTEKRPNANARCV